MALRSCARSVMAAVQSLQMLLRESVSHGGVQGCANWAMSPKDQRQPAVSPFWPWTRGWRPRGPRAALDFSSEVCLSAVPVALEPRYLVAEACLVVSLFT